jgi:micrococcal nuclease
VPTHTSARQMLSTTTPASACHVTRNAWPRSSRNSWPTTRGYRDAGLRARGAPAAAKMATVRTARVMLAAAVVLAGAACGRDTSPSPSHAAADAGRAEITRVVDGDTVRVTIGGAEERVRLIGIDTPETHGQGGLRECFGAEASRRMTELLPPGTPVRLVRDVEARDRYDRLLAYVYRASDGLFVNLAMAREGFATTLTYPPNVAHADELVAAVRAARQARRGLWGRCGGPDVSLPAGGGNGEGG